MKKTILLPLLWLAFTNFAQDGTSKNQAIQLTPHANCTFENFSTGNPVIWHKFVATSEDVSINLKTEKFGNNVPHIHHVAIYEGSSTTEKTHDELPFHNPSNSLKINLNASRLTVGETYYLRLDREAHIGKCDKANCKNSGSGNLANYGICIQEETIFIPSDFEDEKPLMHYALEQNKGQLLKTDGFDADEVLFFNTQIHPAVFITNEFVSLAFSKLEATTNEMQMQRIDMEFVNSAVDKRVFKGEETTDLKNYYLPHNEMGNLDVKSYKRIVMQEIYPDIDLHYYSQRNGMKYYFKVGSKGNATDILLRFNGATDVIHNADGSLDLVSEFGRVTFERPLAYQINPAGQTVPMPWQGEFDVQSNKEVRFKVKNYPHEMPLIIRVNQRGGSTEHVRSDNRMWATYYGGKNHDEFNDIATDEDGDIYFVGTTNSLLFPSLSTNIIPGFSISRIVCGSHQPSGVLRWSTIYGTKADFGNAIATDKLGNVYITGVSSNYLMEEQNKFITVNQGNFNMKPLDTLVKVAYAFISKFDQSDGELKWSSLFGEHTDGAFYQGTSICTNESGDVYIGGQAKRISNGWIEFQNGAYVDSTVNVNKAFIAKFEANNNTLIWSSLFGNNGTIIHDMALDRNQNLFITGETTGVNEADFPLVEEHPGDFINAFDGGTKEAFVAKFDRFDKLKWSTMFGGDYEDIAYGIAISGTDDVAVVGSTMSPNFSFPLKNIGGGSHYTGSLHSTMDAFITVFELPATNPTKYDLKYSTYFGGDESIDRLRKVTYTYFGTMLAVGTTYSEDIYNQLQDLPGAYNQYILENDPASLGTHSNAFIFATDENYNHVWSTLFGGKPNAAFPYGTNDEGLSIAAYSNQYFYICGNTNSQSFFPVTEPADSLAYFQEFNGNSNIVGVDADDYSDGYLAQFSLKNTVLGTEKINWAKSKSNFKLYPNPSNSNVTIVNPNGELNAIDFIRIFDISGKLVKSISRQFNWTGTKINVEVNDLPAGYYNLVLSDVVSQHELKLIKY